MKQPTMHQFPDPFNAAGNGAEAIAPAWRTRFDSELLRPAINAAMAPSAEAYAGAYADFFCALDAFDALLDQQRYLDGGAAPSAADSAFCELLALFELVFHGLFKLNRNRLAEFRNLAHYLRDIAARRGHSVEEYCARARAWYTLEPALNQRLNPLGRMPRLALDLSLPHDRDLRFGKPDTRSDSDEAQDSPRLAGEWVRGQSAHRARIVDDSAAEFPAARGRYHLYIANNCPWSHRAALARSLKGLDDVVSMDVLFYRRDPERGWQFCPDEPRCTPDTVNGARYVREIYESVGSNEKSVPLLWDRQTGCIVSNESADIVRMFDDGFGALASSRFVLYPAPYAAQIDRLNVFTYHAINNGAYKAGFASAQEAYEAAYDDFFAALGLLNEMLRGRRYLLGEQLTAADLRLFPTLFRFDAVYFTRFNLNACMIADLPPLTRWLERMQAHDAVARASDLEHCRLGYFGRSGNNLIPLGPRRL